MRTCVSRVFIVGLILTVSACGANAPANGASAAAADADVVVTTSLGTLTGEHNDVPVIVGAMADEGVSLYAGMSEPPRDDFVTGVRRERLDLFDVISTPATNQWRVIRNAYHRGTMVVRAQRA